MNQKLFNLDTLFKTGHFRREASVWFFWKEFEYHQALHDFFHTFSPNILNFAPAVIVSLEDDCAQFIEECYKERSSLLRLGILPLLDVLDHLEEAAMEKNLKELTDGFVRFRATLTICLDAIKAAML